MVKWPPYHKHNSYFTAELLIISYVKTPQRGDITTLCIQNAMLVIQLATNTGFQESTLSLNTTFVQIYNLIIPWRNG